MDAIELLDELSKKTKYELKYALVSLMLAGKIDFLDVNSAYIDSLKEINENSLNKLFEAESCVLESFYRKKGNKKEYDKKHTQRCLYWLKANGKYYLTLSGFCNDIFGLKGKMEMLGKEYTIEKLMLYSISVFFMERGEDEIVLKAPVYSRKLFKKGLAFNQTFRRNYNGMTYAEQNRYAKSVFNC